MGTGAWWATVHRSQRVGNDWSDWALSIVSSVAQLYPTLCTLKDCNTPGFPVHHQLPELAPTQVHPVSDAIQPSHPLYPLLLLPSIFPSIRVFSNESVLYIRWPKYWSFSFSISPRNEYSGLISFRIDWLDPLAVQETLSLLQHHNSKASILQHSAFFMAQLSHPHMTTGKTIALTRWTFVGKIMSLLFNILSTTLSTSIKLWAMPCRATKDGKVMVESSDKMWSTGEGNGKPLQYSCLENPMNSMKRQKVWPKDEHLRSVGAQYATGDQWRNNSRKNE